MPKFADRVAETTATTGTGAITLAGAKTGYRAFSAAFSSGDRVGYAISGGAEWEVGVGTISGTLSRDTVLASSNAGALVSFSAGSKDVFCSVPARILSGGVVEVPFSAAVSFAGTEQMAQQTVTGPISFTVDVAGAVDGAIVSLDLIANGTNAPTFSGDFRQWGGSTAYDNRIGIRNSITFFRRSGVYYYAITQAVGAVAEPVAIAPTFSVAPVLIGAPAVGAAASFTSGTFAGSPVPTVTVQWLLNDVAIVGATALTYTPVGGDSGGTLKVRQTATNASGSATSTSAGAVVAAALVVPGAPSALAAGTVTSSTIPLAWGVPGSGGGSITDYVIQYAAAGTSFASPTTVADGTSATTGATVASLVASTSYDLRVAAVNGAGQGAWAELLAVSTAAAAPAASLVALQNLVAVTESPAYTYTSDASGSLTPGGNSGTAVLAGDGYISIDLTASANRFQLGLDAVAGRTNYELQDYCGQLYSNGSLYISANTATLTIMSGIANAAGASTRYRLARVSGTVTFDKSINDGATWTTLYTFPVTTSAPLYASWRTVYGALKLVNPRALGLA